MKTKVLLITTIMSTGLLLSGVSTSYSADITTGTVTTARIPISKEAISDPRIAATSFVEHVNYARVALAMKNVDLAKQHIAQARNMSIIIKAAKVEERRVTRLESGRIIYEYTTDYKYHYFPIQTGPVQVKQVSNGPIWAKNDLAVTDADIVYLTLDLTGDKTETYLADAEVAIASDNLKEADNQLAKLTEAVVTVDSKVSVPSDKASDNISLARNFLLGDNYAGASFALKHADDALDEMQKDDVYKERRKEIITMRKEVSELQGYITKKNPTMINKAGSKLEKWGKDLKSWSSKK
jgi:hypothetical protein